MISDLQPLSLINTLIKYADDATLVSPENTDIDIKTEFDNIKSWVTLNRMIITVEKTKEIVFQGPNPTNFIRPIPVTDICQVTVTWCYC